MLGHGRRPGLGACLGESRWEVCVQYIRIRRVKKHEYHAAGPVCYSGFMVGYGE